MVQGALTKKPPPDNNIFFFPISTFLVQVLNKHFGETRSVPTNKYVDAHIAKLIFSPIPHR